MASKLIDKIVQKITVDYCRLTIAGNQDGFLAKADVRHLIHQQSGIEVVVGSNLQLRIHFELEYKQHPETRYIYVCNSLETLVDDMRQEAYVTTFSISDLFPLFADKSLLRKQNMDVLDRLYDRRSLRRISMSEGRMLIESILQELESEKRKSGDFFLSQLRSLQVDWNNRMVETISSLSAIIYQAIQGGVYEAIEEDVARINETFQTWIDEHYFAMQNTNPLLSAKCVNKILPHLAAKYKPDEKLALIVVDGMSYWQYHLLKIYLQQQGVEAKDQVTLAWLPTITMLSRQAIFRGANPLPEYKQNPENERKLWFQYWQQRGIPSFDIQYISDKDEFAIDEGVRRLAYVTVEMDEKMHSSTDYRDLCSLTENWCSRITEKIITLRNAGYDIYLTTDHGSVLSHGWRKLSNVEKVFLYKDGSRGKRHLIYNNKVEQRSFFEQNKDAIPLLCHDDWLAVRNNVCFEAEGKTIITHGGSHLMEMVIPFAKIERKE